MLVKEDEKQKRQHVNRRSFLSRDSQHLSHTEDDPAGSGPVPEPPAPNGSISKHFSTLHLKTTTFWLYIKIK